MTAEAADGNVPERARGAQRLILAALLALGAAARIFGAWCYRNGDNPDYGIVALMAKHMAEGTDWPVFFYGQAYMGSAEPAVSAALCRLFGTNGFMVCLGSALVGLAMLPVVYAWARDAAGIPAGLAALAYCVLGPEGYFHYQCSPRGGYPITLLLGTLILWQTVRVAGREAAGRPPGATRYALLGALAGLGVWSNFLIAPALLAAALVYVAARGRRALSWRALAALPAFAAGSLPLWLWNVAHGWASLDMGAGGHGRRFFAGLGMLVRTRAPALFGPDAGPPAWRAAILAVHVLLAASACVLLRRSLAQGRRESARHLGAALTFVAAFAAVYSASGFPQIRTARYLLPLVPAAAVLAGAGTVALARGPLRRAGWAPLLALLAWQARDAPNHLGRAARYADRHAAAVRLEGVLRREKLSAVYSPYLFHGLNFALNEAFAFAEFRGERCPPLARAVEEADEVGVLNNHGGVNQLLLATGGRAETARLGRYELTHALAPPTNAVATVPAAQWESAVDSRGREAREALTDHNLGTGVEYARGETEIGWVAIGFRQPTTVCGVRVLSRREDEYPASWRIDGRAGPAEGWTNLTEVLQATQFFWSGPRVYCGGSDFRLECRFAPVTVAALRVGILTEPRSPATQLAEIEVLGPAETSAPETKDALDGLLRLIEERGIDRLYGDRWVANAVRLATGGRVLTPREPSVYGGNEEGPWVKFGPRTALLMPLADGAAGVAGLAELGISMRRTAEGPWAVFDFGPGEWREEYAAIEGLCWPGFAWFAGTGKQLAEMLVRRAEAIRAASSSEPVIPLLERAVAAYANHRPAVRLLEQRLREAGRDAEAEPWGRKAAAMWTPETPADIAFPRRIRLRGVTLPVAPVRPGGAFTVRYFWECPPGARTTDLAAFVHFRGPAGQFQDDHILLADADTGFQPFPEVFVEERTVAAPPDLKPGDYAVWLGLVSRQASGHRLRPSTDLKQTRRAVHLPASVIVNAVVSYEGGL